METINYLIILISVGLCYKFRELRQQIIILSVCTFILIFNLIIFANHWYKKFKIKENKYETTIRKN